MRLAVKLGVSIFVVTCATLLAAQDLAPRAYAITPLHSNAVTFAWSYYNGGVDFNGTIPVKDARGTYNVEVLSAYHSFNFFGRSANVLASLPYAVGNFTGELGDQQRSIYRSGLLDFSARVSVNLYGGRTVQAKDYRKWKQKVLLGASLRVVAPTGQYDPTKLINWGINRWAFKPEFGYSQRWGNVILDGYAGVWFYTTNNAFYSIPTPQPQTESPIGSLEGHLSYDFQNFGFLKGLRGWASLDGNFWWGGTTEVSSIRNLETKQTSSRIGATISLPYTKHQSIKIAYSDGAYVRFGGNYQNVSVAWQYSWLGKKLN
jgi:Putative MetA-pathway of phenol degradation